MDSFFQAIGIGNFIIFLGVLVFVHELGHYLVARWCGVRVEVFSVGFGKEIFGWFDKRGTRWKVAMIPLGGYVKMFGEKDGSNPGEDNSSPIMLSDEEKAVSFAHKSLSQRAAIVAAGPLINLIFAVVIFASLFMVVGRPVVEDGHPVYDDFMETGIGYVVENSAAFDAGFEEGDIILAAGPISINKFDDLRNAVKINQDKLIPYSIIRSGEEIEIKAAAREQVIQTSEDETKVIYRLGIGPSIKMETMGPIQSVVSATGYTWTIIVMTFDEIGKLFVGSGDVDNLGGPIKIAQMSSDVGKQGALAVFSFVALLSINLGLLNLFPIPMLDGGHLLFYAIEAITSRPVPDKFQEYSLRVGLALLLTLMVFVTGNDLKPLITGWLS